MRVSVRIAIESSARRRDPREKKCGFPCRLVEKQLRALALYKCHTAPILQAEDVGVRRRVPEVPAPHHCMYDAFPVSP